MAHDQVLRRLTTIFREIFDDEDLVPTPTMSAKDVPEWDSLSHVRLMLAIERAFRIHFTTAEVSGIPDVGHLVDAIVAKLAADGRAFEG